MSYEIIGIAFEVFNDLGYGYKEKYYERAMSTAFDMAGINYKRQCPYVVHYKGEIMGRYYMDFVVGDKVVIENKQGDYFSHKNIKQLSEYLKATGLKLGILINFTTNGVRYKLILNVY